MFDEQEDSAVEQFIAKHKLKYEATYNRADDYYDWIGIEIPEKLYTYLCLLENNWHIQKSVGAVGEASRTQ